MSSFEYKTTIGEYNESVRVNIALTIDNGLSKEDYETLRNAFQVIEETAYKYQRVLTSAPDQAEGEA